MTHMTEAKDQPGEELLRTGELGRIRTTAALREQLLDEFERSGLNGKSKRPAKRLEFGLS